MFKINPTFLSFMVQPGKNGTTLIVKQTAASFHAAVYGSDSIISGSAGGVIPNLYILLSDIQLSGSFA
ncbi:hypothetical protein [Paenibacillus nasutitermitis]|uniref:Uncharacterized protein n=1 Tax=Paenibacillus nasutitermitis TaxID=1652958 RepID=A0A916ZFD4_9BACL|nr:hypothetical protein [Paenibacillus nasutitermitis]GGD93814.1 hypothetical protein GCM10010911_60590 [Paenibacillus nasutitermitis]